MNLHHRCYSKHAQLDPGSSDGQVKQKHAALKSKNKDWLARNHNNVDQHVYRQAIASVS